jgi:hypothetical protein
LAHVAIDSEEGIVALEGNLREFSLADMFRLLDKGGKSGTLHVTGRRSEGIVCFRDGQIFYASASIQREAMGKRLTRAGIISEKQLRQAQGLMKIQKRDKADRKLGQILVDEGYVDSEVLEALVSEQVTDALFELLRWDEGELRFEAEEHRTDVDLGLALRVDDAVAEAEKRLEAWERIREKIPSLDTCFEMSASPGLKPMDIHLKPREWMLLCYLHGSKSVSELATLSGYNDFDTARTLYGMYTGGLVEKVEPAGEQTSD